jgi:hypothetical protein
MNSQRKPTEGSTEKVRYSCKLHREKDHISFGLCFLLFTRNTLVLTDETPKNELNSEA